jgi:hypothetical protein
MFNRLLGNVKLVRYVLQLLSDYYNFLTVRYNEVLLYLVLYSFDLESV